MSHVFRDGRECHAVLGLNLTAVASSSSTAAPVMMAVAVRAKVKIYGGGSSLGAHLLER